MLFTKINLSVLLIVFLFCSFSTLFSQSKGGRWQFENNGFDTADWDGLTNNGVLQGEATYSSELSIPEGTAYLWLDPSVINDFFKINDSNDLDFDNENIGISAWIYPDTSGSGLRWLINKGDHNEGSISTNYSMRISKSENLEFLVRDSVNAKKVESSFKIIDGKWTFVAVFYDYAAEKVYMWNTLTEIPVDTLDFAQYYFSNDAPLAIGSWYSSNPAELSYKDFDGGIDDVRISGRLEDILPVVSSIDSEWQFTKPKRIPKIHVHPNPVNLSKGVGNVTMQFEIDSKIESNISVYNILGQQIFKTTIHGVTSGSSLVWNLKDQYGQAITTGIYFVRLESMGMQSIKKLAVIK